MLIRILLSVAMASSASSGALAAAKEEKKAFAFTVMTYNVENLFDTKDDEGKDDETYLPLSKKNTKKHRDKCRAISVKAWRDQCLHWDWNDRVLAIKMQRLADVVLAYGDKGPDILLLQEVENDAVLEQWQKEYLASAGYQTRVLIPGQDKRGINVALLSRFPLAGEASLHAIDFSGVATAKRRADTREILSVRLKLPNEDHLTAFVVHYPAPFHPIAMRERAMQRLNQLAALAAEGSGIVIAGGDFNITANEDSRLYRRLAGEHWLISHHQLGCERCLGTSYYKKFDSWSFLDALMIYRADSIARKYQVEPDSVEVFVANGGQVAADGGPNRFDLKNGQVIGISDHWPVVMQVKTR